MRMSMLGTLTMPMIALSAETDHRLNQKGKLARLCGLWMLGTNHCDYK